jgi:hypothetical protein
MLGICFDNIAMLVSTVVFFLLSVWGYMILRGRAVQKTAGSMRANAGTAAVSKFACTQLYGALALMFVLSAALLIALGENLMFLVPLFFATGGLLLWRLTGLKVWLLASIAAILLHALSFLYALAMALTIGAFGAVAMLAFCDFMVLIPLADLYMMKTK